MVQEAFNSGSLITGMMWRLWRGAGGVYQDAAWIRVSELSGEAGQTWVVFSGVAEAEGRPERSLENTERHR